MPNFEGRYLAGNSNGYASESLPNIYGHLYATLSVIEKIDINASGFFKYDSYYDVGVQMNEQSILKAHSLQGSASNVSSVYQNNAKVKPDTTYAKMIIKY